MLVVAIGGLFADGRKVVVHDVVGSGVVAGEASSVMGVFEVAVREDGER